MDAFSAGLGAFPLLLAAEGERVRIVTVGGGRFTDRRIADLGLSPGSEITIIQREQGGQMVVAREDMRLALSAGIAHRVLVVRIGGGS
jgi:ferrous iron transport protein A